MTARSSRVRTSVAAALVVLAISTVALSEVFVDEVEEKGQVLSSAGERLTSSEYISEVTLGEPFTTPSELTGGRMVMRPGYIAKKKWMRENAPQSSGVDDVAPAGSPGLVNRLEGNYPNPFNPSTTVRFSLATAGPTSLRIYDVRGRLVRTLTERSFEAGAHEVRWDGRSDAGAPSASGVYFLRLVSGSFVQQHKLVMSR